MLEASVEKYLCDRAKKDLHGLPLKFISPGYNGVPDRIILVPGARIYFVETKAPRKQLRALQQYVRGIFFSLGFEVRRIDTIEKVDAFIAEVQNGV